MRTARRFALTVVVGAFAVAVPAVAKPPHPAHPGHPAASHKCAPRDEAYTASGQLVTWSAMRTADGRFAGPITVHVTTANHHAAGARGTDVTYTLTAARVTFGKGANPPTAGDRVKVIGKATAIGEKCSQSGFTSTITVRKVDVHTAAT
jgi:hypothetical protein